jgi:acetylornithine deacetylase/succinyl-diaminopimelate desuccinylase-like protein
MTDPRAWIRSRQPLFLEELSELLRIPSVSARSEHDGDTRRTAEWVQAAMEAAGLKARVEETEGHPVVLGEWRGAPGAPTVLIYGHYDVQPAEPLDEWSSPPFDPVVRNGRVFARGSADNKGQFFLHLKAIQALMQTTGALPVNVVFLVEGEEEIGSPNLVPFVERRAAELACDVVVISDSAMFAPGLPSLLFSLRGLAYLEIRVRGARSDLHSGAYGGAVPNPAMALARILSTFHDAEGRIVIDGFLDDVVEWDEATRTAIRGLPFDEEEFRDGVGVPGLSGEAGYSTLERLWIRPTCEVNGLLSGYTGEGAKTVLPARAMAKVSFRLVPDQDPARVAEQVRAHLRTVAPAGVEVEVVELHGGRPWRGSLAGPLAEAAGVALREGFGVDPVPVGEGGSIPIVGEFERILGAPVLLLGFALPGANMHAPDEWFPVEHLERGPVTIVRLLEELAKGR